MALSVEIRKVKGVLPMALRLKKEGVKGFIVPYDNAEEAAVADGIEIYPVRTLREAGDFLCGLSQLTPYRMETDSLLEAGQIDAEDFEDVKGQEFAKRSLEIAVSGNHNCLVIGPPGIMQQYDDETTRL